ncbi:acetate--CoA ligase family protein [Myceligenerans xiligouense]|uniref:Acetyltransferase n=1 Tax=Myceligenerans xiligouense TaxID=253184 RepID=A0A3N4YR71_9MICO|nr:acetate--CoA ligase family protein [Myceligenerans xiligouense]RPF21874.1 acetyltransferase [Myceligenerans xiligouense]
MSALDALLRPRGIAVVGASAGPGKAGHAMMQALDGFTGELYPVNPRGGTVRGRTALTSLGELPGPVDLAVLVVPPRAVPGAIEEAARVGVRAAVVCAGGFAESGPEGRRLQERAVEAARRGGVRLLGPNTSGFMNPVDGVFANFMPAAATLRPGTVGIVAQSGGVNLTIAFLLDRAGLGLRLGVGLGNAADTGFADLLDFYADDDATAAVGLHVEGVTDGGALVAALRRLTARKPVVAFKVGRSDVGDFARSHTGSLTGSYELTRAALAQAGAVVVDGLDEMVAALQALRSVRLPAAPRSTTGVAVLTGQAGPGLVVADALGARGVRVPELAPATLDRLGDLLPPLTYQRNPVDTGRPSDTFPDVLRLVAAEPGIDAVGVYALDEPGVLDPVHAVAGTAGRVLYATGGPAAVVERHRERLEDVGVPLYSSPGDLAAGLAALVDDAAARAVVDAPPVTATRTLGRALDEDEAKALFETRGLRTMRRRTAADRATAHTAFDELGGPDRPVVVKVLDAAVLHKSDVGGVHVGVRGHTELDAALDTIDAIDAIGPGDADAATEATGAGTTPGAGAPARRRYLVEEQAPPGTELIVGGIRDAVFGPVVLLGLGGVGVELTGGPGAEPVLRLAPLSPERASEMVDALPDAVLDGFRGAPPVDRAALAAVLRAVSDVLTQHHDVTEIDLNPVRATARGPVVLDAVVVAGTPEEEPHDRHI